MPQTKPTASTALRLHLGDAAPDVAPTRLDFEASGRVMLRYWSPVQWGATAEAYRPRTAVELPDGAWIDLAPAPPPA